LGRIEAFLPRAMQMPVLGRNKMRPFFVGRFSEKAAVSAKKTERQHTLMDIKNASNNNSETTKKTVSNTKLVDTIVEFEPSETEKTFAEDNEVDDDNDNPDERGTLLFASDICWFNFFPIFVQERLIKRTRELRFTKGR
jgi:hypothetical protein